MEKEQKYTMMTVESYPYGWETKYFYMPIGLHLEIGSVVTTAQGKQYRIIDGKTQVKYEDIDLSKYELFDSK